MEPTFKTQEAKSAQTDAAQLREPAEGAYAVRAGFAPRHEPARGEERDSLQEYGTSHGHDELEHHIMPASTYYKVFGALMVLLVLTLVVYFFDFTHLLPPAFAPLSIIIAMSVAIVKAVLVILFFMHVKFSSKLTWVFVGAPFIFVLILFLLTYSDYFSRGMLGTAGR